MKRTREPLFARLLLRLGIAGPFVGLAVGAALGRVAAASEAERGDRRGSSPPRRKVRSALAPIQLAPPPPSATKEEPALGAGGFRFDRIVSCKAVSRLMAACLDSARCRALVQSWRRSCRGAGGGVRIDESKQLFLHAPGDGGVRRRAAVARASGSRSGVRQGLAPQWPHPRHPAGGPRRDRGGGSANSVVKAGPSWLARQGQSPLRPRSARAFGAARRRRAC
jgi:hypothetical protein